MFFNPVHLHWWIIGGIGLLLLFLPFILDGLDFDMDLDLDGGDVFAPAAVISVLLGNPRVPLPLLLGTYFVCVGVFGWVLFALIFQAFGVLPAGPIAFLLTAGVIVLARIPTGWMSKVFAPLTKTTGMDTSNERLYCWVGHVVTVPSGTKTLPSLSSGSFGEVRVIDGTIKTLRAVVADNATWECYLGDEVRILEERTTPRGVSVFVVEPARPLPKLQ